MPQLGIHLITGMINIWPKTSKSKFLKRGFLIGNIIPDLDFLPLMLTYKIDRELAISFHRSFTHSIFIALVFVLIGFALKLKKPQLFYFLSACGLGMFFHSFLDLFMWFASVKIFWPLGHEYSIWRNIAVDDTLWNLMSSLECAVYGIFIYIFHVLIKVTCTNMYKFLVLILFLSSIILILASCRLSKVEFELISYGTAIIIGFIPSIYLIRKHWSLIV